MFFGGELQSSVRVSHRSENCMLRCSILSDALTITSMPMFAKYRAKVERIILFVKIVNQYFERKECFSAAPFQRSFDSSSM